LSSAFDQSDGSLQFAGHFSGRTSAAIRNQIAKLAPQEQGKALNRLTTLLHWLKRETRDGYEEQSPANPFGDQSRGENALSFHKQTGRKSNFDAGTQGKLGTRQRKSSE